MSSFEKTAGKNLDEILASIRKTLADESVDPQTSRKEPLSPLEPSPRASADRNGGKPQSDKIEDDLADLLAGSLTAGPSVAKETPDSATAGDPKDPLWFLRPSGGRDPQVVPVAGEQVSPTVDTVMGGSAVLPPERSGLPPLYVADKATGSGEVGAVVNAMTSAPAPGQAAASPASSADSKTAIEAKAAAKERRSPDAIDPGPAGAGANGLVQPGLAGPAAARTPAPASKDAEGKPEARAAAANTDMAKPHGGQFCCGAGQAARPTPAGGGGKASGAARGWKTRTRCSLDGFALARGGWPRGGQGYLRPPCSGYERGNCGLCAARRDVRACHRECSNRRPRLANPGT